MRPRRKLTILALGAGTIVAVVAAAAHFWRPLASRIVTSRALEQAGTTVPTNDDEFQGEVAALRERFGAWFREGYFDRALILSSVPREGITENVWAPLLVLNAYYEEGELHKLENETAAWLEVALPSSKSRAVLANILTRDFSALETWKPPRNALITFEARFLEVLFKYELSRLLLAGIERDVILDEMLRGVTQTDHREMLELVVGLVTPEHWAAIIDDLNHPDADVRTGAVVMLMLRPDVETTVGFVEKALTDPNELVRVAASGLLALRARDRRGYFQLVHSLFRNERYEVRWWCGICLMALGTILDTLPVVIASETDGDKLLREVFREATSHETVEKLEKTVNNARRAWWQLKRRFRPWW